MGRYEQTPAARPATLALVPPAASLPPGWSVGPCLVFHHGFCSPRTAEAWCRGRWAVSRRRGHGADVSISWRKMGFVPIVKVET